MAICRLARRDEKARVLLNRPLWFVVVRCACQGRLDIDPAGNAPPDNLLG